LDTRKTALVILAAVLLIVGRTEIASGVTITRTYVAPGETFPINGGIAGDAPPNLAGGGNLIDVVNAAADWWELAIRDPHSLEIGYGWSPLGGLTLAVCTQFVSPQPPVEGQIEFDNDGSSEWFMDPTPYDNSEFGTYTETFDDLGGGDVNVGRVFTGATGDAAGRIDLLAVAQHEIGHLMGITSIVPGPIRIHDPLPYPKTRIPMVDGHIKIDSALMSATISSGTRRYLTWVDILGGAERSGWVDVELNPVIVLEADLSGDNFVGQTDLDIVLDQWGKSGAEITDPRADPSGDGFVGQTDLDIVLEDWGQIVSTPPWAPGEGAGSAGEDLTISDDLTGSSVISDAQSVPEPSTIVLLGIAAALGARRRKD